MVRSSLFLHEICLRQSGIFPLQRAGHAASFASLAGFADTPLADLRISGSFSAHAGSTVHDVAPATERERSRAAEDQPGSAVCVSRRNRPLCAGHGYFGRRGAGALPSAGDSTRDHHQHFDSVAARAPLVGGRNRRSPGIYLGMVREPSIGFSPEDNLAYRDYIRLHQRAESFLEARYPMARVLTAWPATDELTRPYLGYITRPMRVVQIENFTAEQMISATDLRSNFDVAMVFSTKYEPRHSLLERWRTWQQWKTRFFGYYRDVPPAAAAQILGGRLVYIEARNGQWVGIIEMEQTIEANAHAENPGGTTGTLQER